jgi:hypothetical protein
VSTTPMSISEAVERVKALRQVQTETGCITRRAQSYLLASLPDDILTEVAYQLREVLR